MARGRKSGTPLTPDERRETISSRRESPGRRGSLKNVWHKSSAGLRHAHLVICDSLPVLTVTHAFLDDHLANEPAAVLPPSTSASTYDSTFSMSAASSSGQRDRMPIQERDLIAPEPGARTIGHPVTPWHDLPSQSPSRPSGIAEPLRRFIIACQNGQEEIDATQHAKRMLHLELQVAKATGTCSDMLERSF